MAVSLPGWSRLATDAVMGLQVIALGRATWSPAAAVDGEDCMSGIATLILSLVAMLAGAAGFAWYVWSELGDVEISMQGYLALAGGVAVTLALGVGLMWLVYYSHRRGYDDEAGQD